MRRGVHFAITEDQAEALRAARGDDDALAACVDAIEDAWDDAWIAESEDAWPGLPAPAREGETLLAEPDVAILIDAARVRDAAKQLAIVPETSVDDRTWQFLVDVRALFMRAARAGRHVLFSVR
jgi:hypothetical protein